MHSSPQKGQLCTSCQRRGTGHNKQTCPGPKVVDAPPRHVQAKLLVEERMKEMEEGFYGRVVVRWKISKQKEKCLLGRGFVKIQFQLHCQVHCQALDG